MELKILKPQVHKTNLHNDLENYQPNFQSLMYEFFHNFESPHTRKSYQLDIQQFFEFLKENFQSLKNFSQIERAHVVSYRNFMNDGELSPKTINRKLASLSSFCDFLVEKSLLNFNPCSSIKRPKHEVKNPTNDLSDEDIKKLFSIIQELKNEHLLHKAVIYLLFTTGIRKAELIQLRLKDYKKTPEGISVVEIKAKGGKFLTKVIHPDTAAIMDDYIAFIRSRDKEDYSTEDWIFRPSRNPLEKGSLNKPLNPKSVDYIIKTWCKKAGIFHRISPHSARASYIGSALDNGVDLYKVSRDVGHASVKTTEEYNKRKKRISDSPVWDLGFLSKPKT